jgi:hypothetical protein
VLRLRRLIGVVALVLVGIVGPAASASASSGSCTVVAPYTPTQPEGAGHFLGTAVALHCTAPLNSSRDMISVVKIWREDYPGHYTVVAQGQFVTYRGESSGNLILIYDGCNGSRGTYNWYHVQVFPAAPPYTLIDSTIIHGYVNTNSGDSYLYC